MKLGNWGIFPKCTWTKLTLMIQLWSVSLQSLNSDLLTTTAVNAIANLYYTTRPMQTCLVSKRHLHTKSEVGEIAKTCKRSSSLLKSSNALVVKASISVAYALSREIGSQGTCLAHSVAFAMLYPSMLRCFIYMLYCPELVCCGKFILSLLWSNYQEYIKYQNPHTSLVMEHWIWKLIFVFAAFICCNSRNMRKGGHRDIPRSWKWGRM